MRLHLLKLCKFDLDLLHWYDFLFGCRYNQSVEAVQERVDDLRYETEGLILKR